MADVNLYPEEPKKVIGEYTEFFAGQLPTANDFNRWLAVLIAQGDYNTAWLDLVAQKAGISINELYTELSILSEIVTPGSGTMFSQRLSTLETNTGGWKRYALVTDIDATLRLGASTMFQIVNKMTNLSMFTTAIDTSTSLANTDIPTYEAGLLDIIKVNGRAILRFTQYNGNTWERVCALTSTESTMTEWCKFVDSNELYTWVDIKGEIVKLGNGASITINYALYNPATKEVRMSIVGNATPVADGNGILQIPTTYTPTSQILIHNAASAKRGTSMESNDYVNGSIIAGGAIAPSFDLAIHLYYFRANFSYIAR